MLRRLPLLGVMLGLCAPLPAHADAARPVLAVFDVEGKSLDDELRSELSDYLATQLAASRQYQIVPRDDVRRRLMKEKRASYRACFDETCQIEIGQELAAEEVVSAQVIQAGDLCILTVRLFDLRRATSSNATAVEGRCGREGLFASMREASTKLAPVPGASSGPVGPLGFGLRPLTPKVRASNVIPWSVKGVYVAAVKDESLAAVAEMGVGQVITAATIHDDGTSTPLREDEFVGLDEITLSDRQSLVLSVWTEGTHRHVYLSSQASRQRQHLGISWVPATMDRLRELGLPREQDGYIITAVDPEGAAAKAGLREGHLIMGGSTAVKGRMVRLAPKEVIHHFIASPDKTLLLRVLERRREMRFVVKPRMGAAGKAPSEAPIRRVFGGKKG